MGLELTVLLCILAGLYGVRLVAAVIENEYRIAAEVRKAENRLKARTIARRRYHRRLRELDERARLEQESSSG